MSKIPNGRYRARFASGSARLWLGRDLNDQAIGDIWGDFSDAGEACHQAGHIGHRGAYNVEVRNDGLFAVSTGVEDFAILPSEADRR